jgi:MFS family permease
MVGLETPAVIQATVFGVSSSAISIGFGLGPLAGGIIASVAGVRAGLAVAAVLALLTAAVLGFLSREPRAYDRESQERG